MKRRHGCIEPGDVVEIANQKYVAILNTPQILTGETSCVGCAFCKEDGKCDNDSLQGFKKFHCGNTDDPVNNQILLKLLE